MAISVVVVAAFFVASSSAKVVNFETDSGATPDADAWDVVWKNGAALNSSLASLAPGDVLVVPNKTYYLMGGIQARDLHSVVIQVAHECRVCYYNAEARVGF